MRTLRWAAELAVDQDDEAKAALGVAQLTALGASDLLDDDTQRLFVDAAMDAVLGDAVEKVDGAGEDAEVVRALGVTEETDVALPGTIHVEEPDG